MGKDSISEDENFELSEAEFRKMLIKDTKLIRKTVLKTEETLQALSGEIEQLKQENVDLKRENERLREDVNELYCQNEEFANRMNDMDQYSRIENIVITGIPVRKDENIREIIKNIAEKVELKIEDSEISTAHRLPSKKSETPNIIARLNNRDKKKELIVRAKAKKLKASVLEWTKENTPIYISNHLTRYTAELLREAKKLRDEGYFEYVWEKDAKILIRKDENSLAVRIKDKSQLETIQLRSRSEEITNEDENGASEEDAGKEERKEVHEEQGNLSEATNKTTRNFKKQLSIKSFVAAQKSPPRTRNQTKFDQRMEKHRASNRGKGRY